MKGLAIKFSSLSFICLLSFLVTQTSSSKAANSSNWPQWRGPDSQGVSNDKNLSTEWSETKNVLWKTALPGKGFSQPIIWGKKVFLTTDIEGGPEPTGYKPPKRMLGEREFTHPEWDGVNKLTRLKRSVSIETPEKLCGSRPPTKAGSTTIAINAAITPLRRRSPTANTFIPISARKASIATTSRAS